MKLNKHVCRLLGHQREALGGGRHTSTGGRTPRYEGKGEELKEEEEEEEEDPGVPHSHTP